MIRVEFSIPWWVIMLACIAVLIGLIVKDWRDNS